MHSLQSGERLLMDMPRPSIGPTEVLLATSYSLLSYGNERATRNAASAGLTAKARARPDLVGQIVQKDRKEGRRQDYAPGAGPDADGGGR